MASLIVPYRAVRLQPFRLTAAGASRNRSWSPCCGQSVTLEEMIGHLKGQVADYKLPEVMHIVAELPFTATGKLRRHVLAEWIAQGRLGEKAPLA